MTPPGPPPLVSVVMIFWNAETFMAEAVESVLAQTHPAIELLLCDDGSVDASRSLARGWARQHPDRVRYVEHPGHAHRGTGPTRTLGLDAARGHLVAFLDADDVWRPDHLRRQLACLAPHPEAAAVCGWALDWRSWRDPAATDTWSPLPWPDGTVVAPPAMMTAVLRDGGYATPVCSLLVRAEAARDLRGLADGFPSMYEDQVLLARLYLTVPVVLCEARTALYRQHPGSSTAKAIRRGSYHPMKENRSRQTFLEWLSAQPQLVGDDVDPELALALAAARLPYQGRWAGLRWRAAAVARPARQAVHLAARPVRRRLRSLRRRLTRRTSPSAAGVEPLDPQRPPQDQQRL